MELSVRANVKDLQKMFAAFPKEVRSAAVSALNKTGAQAKTQMYKRIRERRSLSLSAAAIKALIRTSRATINRLTTSLSISGRPIPLNQFKTRQRKDGISVNVIGDGFKGPVMKHGNKAFTNPNLGGGAAIFVRKTSKRLPIEKLFGPSLPSALTAQGWTEGVLQVDMLQTWERNIVHEIQWRLARYTPGTA